MDRNREERPSRRRSDEDQANELEERLVRINRVSKVHKGGRTFAFGSIVVVGDGKGRVGVGMGKAGEVPDSIRKGGEAAKKSMITVPLDGGTIPHEVEATFGASRVMLKPASPVVPCARWWRFPVSGTSSPSRWAATTRSTSYGPRSKHSSSLSPSRP